MNLFFRPLSSISAVLCLIVAFCHPVSAWAASPVISGTPATAVTVGNTYTFTPKAYDADGQTLSFRIANKPAWAYFNTGTGRLSGTPGAGYIGTYYNIVISVSDGTTRAYLPKFSITVRANRAPTISGTPATAVTVGSTYSFTPKAYDPDGQTLTYRIANKPAWAYFNTATGRLSGTPGSGYIGTYSNIVISVSDGRASDSLASFSITVRANRAPTISGTPATAVTVGNTYGFTPKVYDPDGQKLTFRIANKPAWAYFNTATGRLSGTPGSGYIGTYSNIVISVSDGKASDSLASFTITVRANRTPVISGTPATAVTAGSLYGFTPTASDPDGQALTFRISNKPAWAAFNTSTGRLSGTPGTSYLGTYYNIIISVSDGTKSASLPAFSITVKPVKTSAVTLSWTAPTKNTDGTSLTDLAGYRVFYGTASRQYGQSVSVPNPGITSVVLEGLASGRTWYFSIKSVDKTGVASDYSGEVSKTIL